MRKPVPIIISIYMIVCFAITAGFAQTLFPSKKELDVSVRVSIHHKEDGLFDFNYGFSNNMNSRQTIEYIFLQDKGFKKAVSVPKNWTGSYVDPDLIGMGHLPTANSRKFVSFSPELYPDDNSDDNPPINSIDPGESSDEFYLFGHEGPPMIIWWEIVGWAPMPYRDWQRGVIVSGNHEFDLQEWNDSYLYHRKTLPNGDDRENRLKGFTLGPSVPVADLQTLSDTFLIDLMKQVDEAIELGWVKEDQRAAPAVDRPEKGALPDDGTFYRYTATLGGARQDLLRGNVDSARKKLRAALKQVEAQRGKQLTDEAYYLIKLNVEYLIEKL